MAEEETSASFFARDLAPGAVLLELSAVPRRLKAPLFLHLTEALRRLKRLSVLHGNVCEGVMAVRRGHAFPVLSGFEMSDELGAERWIPRFEPRLSRPPELQLASYMATVKPTKRVTLEDVAFVLEEVGSDACLTDLVGLPLERLWRRVCRMSHTWDNYALCAMFRADFPDAVAASGWQADPERRRFVTEADFV